MKSSQHGKLTYQSSLDENIAPKSKNKNIFMDLTTFCGIINDINRLGDLI